MIGCLIGSTWEFTFHFLGDEFAYAVKQWPLGLSGTAAYLCFVYGYVLNTYPSTPVYTL